MAIGQGSACLIFVYSVCNHIHNIVALIQSVEILFYSSNVLFGKKYFLLSNLFCPFTSATVCLRVLLPPLCLKKIYLSTSS